MDVLRKGLTRKCRAKTGAFLNMDREERFNRYAQDAEKESDTRGVAPFNQRIEGSSNKRSVPNNFIQDFAQLFDIIRFGGNPPKPIKCMFRHYRII